MTADSAHSTRKCVSSCVCVYERELRLLGCKVGMMRVTPLSALSVSAPPSGVGSPTTVPLCVGACACVWVCVCVS